MSNTIQIKRGSSVPTTSQLAEYELGFNTANNTLYINIGAEVVVPFARVALSSFGSQTANYVLAAPNGSNGTPSFRALVAADIPNLAASKITSGTLAIAQGGTGAATAAINTVFAGPGSGSTAAPSFRVLVAADIPNLNASKITDGILAVAQGGTGLTSLATFVRTTGDQTINGTKTFVAYPRIQASATAANSYPSIMFNSSHDTDIARWGVTLSGTGDESRAAYLAGDIYSYNASTKEKISYRERYRLPEVTADLPDNATYYIFTDKNNPTMSRTSGAVYYSATRSDTSTNVWFGVASSGTNHGVYSTKQSRWLIYGDATDVYVANSLYHKITIGTADPSGGSNGDIYIKYTT